MMSEYIYEGEKYYFTGKKWLAKNRIEVPLAVVSKLNNILLGKLDLASMSNESLVKFAIDLKEGENNQLAIKVMELLLSRNDFSIIKNIMPRLVSCYRKVGKSEEAIRKAEAYNSMYKGRLTSHALLTTLAAAYCDIENYEEARKYANRARVMEGEDASEELISVYCRIKKYDGGVTMKDTYEDVPDYNTEKFDKNIDIEAKLKTDNVEADQINESISDNMIEIEFANSLERDAMNRIWKAIPAEIRSERYDDFILVCTSLKQHTLSTGSNIHTPDRMNNDNDIEQYNYISCLPNDIQNFFYKVLKEHNINMYHSVMAVLGNNKCYSEDAIVKLYFDKYQYSRPYVVENRDEVVGLIHYCYKKLHES